MYSYDHRRTAAGPLKVTKTGPIEFEYTHSAHGPVRIAWSGDSSGWFAVTKDHKIHPLGLGGLTPVSASHPNAEKLLIEKVEKVLGG